MEILVINSLKFEVRRSGRRKTLDIVIDRDGALIVSAPSALSAFQIESAVQSKLLLIYTKLAKRKLFFQPQRKLEFVSGEVFHYLGRCYRLKLISPDQWDDPDTPFSFRVDRFILKSDEADRGRWLLRNWYIDNGKPWLLSRIESWIDRIGVQLQGLEVRDLGYRWGSCNHQGKVNFHWRTFVLPPTIIDYIIVHELVHLHEPLHNTEFWRRVKRAIPDFAYRKQWLEQNGGRL